MAPASFSFSPSQSVSERLYIPVSLKHPRLFRPSEQLSHLSKSPSPLLSRVVHQTFLPSSLAYCVTCLGEVSECVLCLGDWRKPAFQVEILTSELQRKLRELFAVGLAPARKSGAPPANSPATCPRAPRSPPPWMGAVFPTRQRVSGLAQPRKVPPLFSQTKRHHVFLCSVHGTLLCTAVSRHIFPSKFVSATCLWNFFFSYLRDKWDLHFPLNTKWLCLSPPPP